jgi:hypothetical protein
MQRHTFEITTFYNCYNLTESENSRLPIIPRDNEESHDIEARSETGNETAPEDIPGPGSMVALLLNLQGLLRMAIETAKLREQKFNSEKGNLLLVQPAAIR